MMQRIDEVDITFGGLCCSTGDVIIGEAACEGVEDFKLARRERGRRRLLLKRLGDFRRGDACPGGDVSDSGEQFLLWERFCDGAGRAVLEGA